MSRKRVQKLLNPYDNIDLTKDKEQMEKACVPITNESVQDI
jgi:hypothetical protein